MSGDQSPSYSIRYEHSQSLEFPTVDGGYVVGIDGEVWEHSLDGDSRSVGKLHGHLVRVTHAEQRGEAIFEVFDAESQELMEVAEAIWDDDHGIFRESLNLSMVEGDVLILELIELDPSVRGKDLGLRVAWWFITAFARGCAVIVMKPYPVQYNNCHGEGREGRPLPSVYGERRLEEAQRKLRKHWSRLGAKRIPRSEFFYIDPCAFSVGLEKFLDPEDD